jgi:hypothetical protein
MGNMTLMAPPPISVNNNDKESSAHGSQSRVKHLEEEKGEELDVEVVNNSIEKRIRGATGKSLLLLLFSYFFSVNSL